MGTKKTAITKQQGSTALAAPLEELEGLAGVGFEEADQDSYVLPYLQIVQKMSPQVDEDSPLYMPDAKPGQFLNTASQELFDEVTIIPVHYQRMMVNWKDREEGGGWLGAYPPEHEIVTKGERDERGRLVLPDGSYLADTRYHYVLIVNDDFTVQPAILSLGSTQIKKSRQWMTQMRDLKIARPDGSKFAAPMFSHLYKLSTVSESNEKGSWKGIKIELVGPLTTDHRDAFMFAKEFGDEIRAGRAVVGDPDAQEPIEVNPQDEEF